ncbi:MAG: alpha/beta hydrolase [Pyrinomonadaceae bacterium]|nr:alpha/beta hydrolase [Pyrinomonadaceae bacterium]
MRTHDDWYFTTDDRTTKIYVREIGIGEPFIVIHGGFGAEHSYLIEAVRGLRSKHRFIFYDQRGSLRSPTAPENISVDKHVADIESLRRALGLEQINLLGHSMGTLLAMKYMRTYPGRTKKVVLVGALYPRAGRFLNDTERELKSTSDKQFVEFTKRPEVAAEFEKLGMKGAEKPPAERSAEENKSMAAAWPKLTQKQKAHLDRISSAAPNIFYIERWPRMAATRPNFKQDAGSAAFKTLETDYDFVAELRTHSYPVTVIIGDHDLSDFGAHRWSWLNDELNLVRLNVIKRAGHNIWIDQPRSFRSVLSRVLMGDTRGSGFGFPRASNCSCRRICETRPYVSCFGNSWVNYR